VQIAPGVQDVHSNLLSHPGPSGLYPVTVHPHDPTGYQYRSSREYFAAGNPLDISTHPPVNKIEEMNGRGNEVDDEMYYDEEQEEQEVSSELDDPEWYTPATTPNDSTSVTAASDEGRTHWVHDPTLNLVTPEQLHGSFGSELESPSAWVLQKLAVLTGASSDLGPQVVARFWYREVAYLTNTPSGEPLRLPPVTLLKNYPSYEILSSEEARPPVGTDQGSYPREEVDEKYKQVARLSIEFLFPEAKTSHLLAIEKERILTVVSTVSGYDRPRALGLLLVLEEEYPDTRLDPLCKGMENFMREWADGYLEEFMVYTVFYPPPLLI